MMSDTCEEKQAADYSPDDEQEDIISQFNEKLALNAFSLISCDVTDYERVEISANVISQCLEQPVNLYLFDVVTAGLPNSGKSTLLKSVFNTRAPKEAPGLRLYETILHQNCWTNKFQWVESTKLQAEVHSMLLAFAQCFTRKRWFPKIDSLPSNIIVFDDADVQSWFDITFNCLHPLLKAIHSVNDIKSILENSLGLSNVYDLGVSKAAYEFVTSIGGGSNMLFVNVLDISKYDCCTILEPMNLKDHTYNGRYTETQASTFVNQIPLNHFIGLMEVAKNSPTLKMLVVGTHIDKIESSNRKSRVKECMIQLRQCGKDFDVEIPEMIAVDARDKDDCQKVNQALIQLLKCNKSFKVEMSMRFIFFRYVLFCTKKIFMSRKELTEYARKCGISSEVEIEKFLVAFRNCGSIVYYDVKDKFLNSYIVLNLIDFLKEIDKLYNITEAPFDISEEWKALAKFGFIHEDAVKLIWPDTEAGLLSNSEFYVSALENVGLLVKLQHGRHFFVPSMRLEHDSSLPEKNSLVITTDVSLTPVSRKQCYFVRYLTENHHQVKLDQDCAFYNCLKFTWTDSNGRATIIKIGFFRCHIEVFIVSLENSSDQFDALLYSRLKTDCFTIMTQIKEELLRTLRFNFCIVCPNGCDNLISFRASETETDVLMCKCGKRVDVTSNLWVKSVFGASRKSTSCSEDILDPSNLVEICKTICKSTPQDITKMQDLANFLKVECCIKAEYSNEEILFDVLYKWHQKNPLADKLKLARRIRKFGLIKEAYILDPKLHADTDEPCPEVFPDFTTKEVTLIANSWPKSPAELASVLDVQQKSSNSEVLQEWLHKNVGDERRKLKEVFNEYPTMTNAIDDL